MVFKIVSPLMTRERSGLLNFLPVIIMRGARKRLALGEVCDWRFGWHRFRRFRGDRE